MWTPEQLEELRKSWRESSARRREHERTVQKRVALDMHCIASSSDKKEAIESFARVMSILYSYRLLPSKQCSSCNGSGRVEERQGYSTCGTCDGSGEVCAVTLEDMGLGS